jgi:choline dehydrogenase
MPFAQTKVRGKRSQAQRGVRKLVKRESLPGKLDKLEMEAYARNAAFTYWHQSCTAKMERDPMSVVDNQLRVYGVEKLRVADASIMPHVTSGTPWRRASLSARRLQRR